MSTPSHEEITPNQYHLHGGDISVSYYPEGAGPVIKGRGRLRFTYHDLSRALSFYGDDVRTVDVPDLGTVVSVTIAHTTDTGSTSASLARAQSSITIYAAARNTYGTHQHPPPTLGGRVGTSATRCILRDGIDRCRQRRDTSRLIKKARPGPRVGRGSPKIAPAVQGQLPQ